MRGWLKIWASVHAQFEANPPPGSSIHWGHFSLSAAQSRKYHGIVVNAFLTLYEATPAPQPSSAACLALEWQVLPQS